jgi:hypothetical protein
MRKHRQFISSTCFELRVVIEARGVAADLCQRSSLRTMIERTTTLSEIIASGIAARDPEFDERASSGGKTVNIPFWKEITGSSEVLKGSAPHCRDKITSGQHVAAINNRGKAWGVNDLAKWISGIEPAGHIATIRESHRFIDS